MSASMTQDAFVPPANQMSLIQLAIASACDEVKELLLEKNAKYGNSALDPVRIFSQSSPVEQILVRIDDKLSRIQRGAGLIQNDEDVIKDLTGYLILLRVALLEAAKDKEGLEESKVILKASEYYTEMTTEQWDGVDIEPVHTVCK